MERVELSSEYWENRYQTSQIGWDLGEISPPLKHFFDTLADKSLRILVPGAGNAYEVEYLHGKGFDHVDLLDYAPSALMNFKQRVPTFPDKHLIAKNFFEHHGQYDLIVEHTFFCALYRKLRPQYVEHMHNLLVQGGHLAGLLFSREIGGERPPWGGDKGEYRRLFSACFSISSNTFVEATNSHLSRQGWEYFFEVVK